VIAADDGIMPQTREAIMHAQAAEVSLIVAINKIDLPSANVDQAKQQLQQMQLAPEDWGGETICCPVSAQTGEGIDHLLEMILLQADVMQLQANPKRLASGYVIEASLQPGMGPTVNLLVTRGTLNLGDSVLCDRYSGKVRALINDHGVKVKSAGPSTPVRCLGLSGVPEAGASFRICQNDRMARTLAQNEDRRLKAGQTAAPRKASLEALYEQIEQSQKIELNLILKTDTQGSLEAILHSFEDIPDDKVALHMILRATGNITESDVLLASASSAVILGFHVAKESGVDAKAKHEGVEVQLHSIIYELIERVRDGMVGLLPAQVQETVTGRAQVQQVFVIGKQGTVAGCMCVEGAIGRSHRVRVKRGDEILFEGSVASLKHFQDDVSEVRQSQECGIRLNGFGDYETGDVLEFYELAEIEQTL
ncbi:MAG: translation initiation factor IF-2, partial [Lentisphaerae bacterium]|nr:translation initiation factor IF-2 [Lentisphaerota bacterium]